MDVATMTAGSGLRGASRLVAEVVVVDRKEADGVDRVAVGSQRGGRGQAKAHVTNVRRAHRAGHEQHVTARRERVGGLEAEVGSHGWQSGVMGGPELAGVGFF
ncbi:hypothetical protein EMIHUDRAFT_317826 [Emiliania huxleyi CCMP1516]|uniref:Uncharacterized protein n=2 Tax=Emiliania huxleyi TaxID=2903 RepID=A0A0D3JPQ2_EMIH1|nr:hypothetical protein EMIHUDRAFT_317826 [Emiliania huxleyi CCMP1516]EOD25487.1 hypothetical protein EMIHUDRAFT_317826 [Emiliania huxleyi CCMP1516]|eukprot:XP_005777916.1 hypothetical protein EMIHUDRAFT_317826 [Emiliania huxleyi CCMP1516]